MINPTFPTMSAKSDDLNSAFVVKILSYQVPSDFAVHSEKNY
jgi:hypothetical protein